jgi:membrane protein implicated in regulation of membrane protease activity
MPSILRNVQSSLGRLGLTLCTAAAGLCGSLHLATFVTIVAFLWLLPAFFLLFSAVLCAKGVESDARLRRPSGILAWLGVVLLVYAVLTFVYFYRTTGGASSVSIVNGEYVSMYKGQILRTITEQEYRMFPNLWVRVMTAWMAMMAVAGLAQFPSIERASEDV